MSRTAEPAFRGLHHVALPFPGTPEAEASARLFYVELIGLRELQVPETISGVLWFDAGAGTELHLFTHDDDLPRSPRHPCLRVAGIGTLRERLARAGVELIDPTEQIPGRRRLFAFDPFGNAIEFAEFD